MSNPEMKCPRCRTPCHRDEVDVGVGIICGPWGCPGCGWSESDEYDLSAGQNPVDARGGAIDQYGGYHPPQSRTALAIRIATRQSMFEERSRDKCMRPCDVQVGGGCSCWNWVMERVPVPPNAVPEEPTPK